MEAPVWPLLDHWQLVEDIDVKHQASALQASSEVSRDSAGTGLGAGRWEQTSGEVYAGWGGE